MFPGLTDKKHFVNSQLLFECSSKKPDSQFNICRRKEKVQPLLVINVEEILT